MPPAIPRPGKQAVETVALVVGPAKNNGVTSEPIRLLLVEDHPSAGRRIRRLLNGQAGGDFQITHVRSVERACRRLERQPWDLAVLRLPANKSQALAAIRRLRASSGRAPVVALADRSDPDLALAAVQSGATDCLPYHESDGHDLARTLHMACARFAPQSRMQATAELLALFAHKTDWKDYIDAAAALLRDVTGCRCVGIRLRTADRHVPYQAAVGFSKAFQARESDLSLDRDDCICTRMIDGRLSKADRSAVSPGGSFVCADAAELVKGMSASQRKTLRGVCVEAGFRTVVVVPIRHQRQTLGVIHLADERPNMVRPGMAEFLESIAPLIGEARARFEMRQELQAARNELEARVAARTDSLASTNDALVAEILQREHQRHRLARLADVSQQVLAEMTMAGLLQRVIDAARDLTGAKLGVAGHMFSEGHFDVWATSRAPGVKPCPPGKDFTVDKGGVYLELMRGAESIRLGETQLKAHPAWRGLPRNHPPLRGLLGARLFGRGGKVQGMILLSDKDKGDFTAFDETMLTQLAAVASLGLQHIEARGDAEKRAAEAEEGRRVLDSVMDNIPEAIVVAAAPDWRIRRMSRFGEQMVGRSLDAIGDQPGQRVQRWEVYGADGQSRPREQDLPIERARRGEQVSGEELAIRDAQGKLVPILVNAGPIRDEKGAITGAVVSWSDITARKQAEWELAEARAQAERRADELDAVFHSLTDPVVIYNAEGTIYKANPAALEAYGLDPASLDSEVSLDRRALAERMGLCRLDGSEVPVDERPANRALRGEAVVGERLLFGCQSGRSRMIEVSAAPIYSDGRLVGAAATWHDVTEREELINELELQRARLETILRQMPAGVIIAEAAGGRILMANEQTRRIWGCGEEHGTFGDFTARHQGYHPDGRPYGIDDWPLSRAMRDGEVVVDEEIDVFRVDGRPGVLLASAAPVRDRQGRIVAGVLTFHDITARKQAEEDLLRAREELEERVHERTAQLAQANTALWESSELLERAFSSISLLVAYMDRDFNFIRVNPAYAAAGGHEPEYYVGKNHFAMFPNAENEEIFRHVVQTGQPYAVIEKPFEYVEHPERGVSYWDWSLQPVKGPDGQVAGVVLSLVDATERRRAKDDLQQSEARIRAIFDQTFQLMGLLTPDGTVVEANRAMLDIIGADRAAVIGRRFWHTPWFAASPETRKRMRSAVKDAAAGRFIRQEIDITRPDGEKRAIDFSLRPMYDDGGRVMLLIPEGRDITQRRRLEREIVDISQQEQQRIGQDLHDTLGQLLTGTAFLSKVLAQKLAEQQRPEAAEAEKISALLNQATLQTRALARGLCPVDLQSEGLMTALLELSHEISSVFGIRCDFDCPEPILLPDTTVATNLYYIAQEATNNAIRHGKGERVVISLSRDAAGIVLSVRDNGVGLSDEAREHGGGMGLHTMNYRARVIGASFEARREPSGGTSIMCTLPDSSERP